MQKISPIAKTLLFYICSIILIIWPAIYNGYPLVYSDSGTYLNSSIDLITPMDRPIFYGFFLRITAMQERNWIPIIIQALIGAFLIKQVIACFFKNNIYLISLIVIILLAIFTGLPWYASQLMPDIFTSYGGLSIFLLLFKQTQKTYEIVLYYLILLLSVGVHLSNLFIFGLLVLFLFVFQIKTIWANKKQSFIKYGSILVTLGISVLIHCSINLAQHDTFAVSRGSNLFLVAKCLDTPLLKTYMKENSNHLDIPFMNEIDSIPNSACGFLWDSKSPVNYSGIDRVEINKMYAPIVKDIFSQPKYRWMFIKEMFLSAYYQVQFHRVGSGLLSYSNNSAPYYVINAHFGKELKHFETAKQFSISLEDNYHKHISMYVFYFSLFTLIFGLAYPQIRKINLTIILFAIAFVYFNALITAGLANVYDRLQVRVVWLLTFAALIIIFSSIQLIQKKITKNKEVE